jgi:hypothetical protein
MRLHIYLVIGLILGLFLIVGPVSAGEPPLKWKYLIETDVQSVSVSENGFIAIGSENSVHLLAEDGSLLWEEHLGVPIESISTSNNGQYILAGADKFIYKFDMGKLITDKIRVWFLPTNFSFHDITVSRRGFYTIAGTAADSLFGTTEDAAYVKNNAIETDYNEYTSNGKVYDVSISKKGNYVAMVSSKRAQLLREEKIIWSHDIGNAYSGFVSISPDGTYVAVGFDRTLDLLDQDGRNLWSLDLGPGLWDLSVSENGEYVAVGLGDQVWFLNRDGELLWRYQIDSKGYVGSISVSSTGKYVAAASDRGVYFFENRPSIIVLANSIDRSMASPVFAYLQDMGINLVHASARDFNQFKNDDFIVILGGPDAYDGVGEVVQEVLAEDEADFIRAPGSLEMILKKDVWSKDQIVIVIAGQGRNQTKLAGEEKKEELAKVWKKGEFNGDEILSDFTPIIEIVDESIVLSPNFKFWFEGLIKNTGNSKASSVKITLKLFDKSDRVINLQSTSPMDLGPDTTSLFTFKTDILKEFVHSYSLTVTIKTSNEREVESYNNKAFTEDVKTI